MANVSVKVCGITNFDDAQVALQAGADYLGFILYPRSPRYVTPEKIRQILWEIRDWRLSAPVSHDQSPLSHLQSPISPQFVGVFVDDTAGAIADILTFTGLDYAQLHGDEPLDVLRALAGKAFKAIRPAHAQAAEDAAARLAPLGLNDGPQLLIDAYDPAQYGGTGQKVDWTVAAELARSYPRLVLAGGLTPANVAQAVRRVRPWAVDVSSGVEIAPGRKNHDAVRAFVRAARGSTVVSEQSSNQ